MKSKSNDLKVAVLQTPLVDDIQDYNWSVQNRTEQNRTKLNFVSGMIHAA